MVTYNYTLNTFISTPTAEDKYIKIYDKYGTLKYTVDPKLAYFYYKSNFVYIKVENSNDIVLDFESNIVAISALEKLNSVQKTIVQQQAAEIDYYTKEELNLGALDNRYYTQTAITNILQDYSLTSHTHNLVELIDVSLSAITNNEVLVYKDGLWVNSSFTFDTSAFTSNYYTIYDLSSSTNDVWINWVHIYNTPTGVSGYGITDVYSKDDVYTKAELNPQPGTPGGTGELDDRYYTKLQTYTKDEIDDNFLSANTSFYSQSEANANFLSANTSFYTREYIDANFSITGHTHPDYSLSSHTHTDYALSSHTHTDYSLTSHTHNQYSLTSHTHSFYGLSNTSHTHVWGDIVTAHTHLWSDIVNTSHTHSDIYYTKLELDGGQLDDLYYTKLQTYTKQEIDDNFLSASTLVYTKSEVENNFLSASTINLFNNYSLSSHTHYFGGLSGISITSPQNNDFLIYYNGLWINSAVSFDLSNYYTKSELDNGQLDNLYIPLAGTTGITGSLIPATNGTFSLGSPTRQWKELWVSGSTIYIDSVPISITSDGKLTVGGEVIETSGETAKNYSVTGHSHDDRYFTKTELLPVNSPLGVGALDDRYYTKLQTYTISQIDANFISASTSLYTKDEIDANFLSANTSFYTQGQIDSLFSNLASIYSITSHTHNLSDLQNTAHTHSLASLSNTSHTHDERYYTQSQINTLLTGFASSTALTSHILMTGATNPHQIGFYDLKTTGHSHNNLYYTKTELNPQPGTPYGTGTLDDRYYTKLQVYDKAEIELLISAATFSGSTAIYYTKTQVDNILTNYSLTSHTHDLNNLTDVDITLPFDGDVLIYSGGTWVNADFDVDLSDYYTSSQTNALLQGYSTTGHTHLAQQVIFNEAGTTAIAVGGIASGTNLENKSIYEIFDMMLYPELFPTLTAPSNGFSLTQAGLHEIGESLTLNFTATFNRGSINPQYTATSPYRSGNPTNYNYNGPNGMTYSIPSTSLSDSQISYNFYVSAGTHTWTNTVSYSMGVQPKSSKGNNYNSPLPAGTTSTQSVSIIGVYPYFGTTSNITTLTKQPLTLMNSAYVEIDMVGEDGVNKQKAKFPVAWSTITGIQFFNTVSNTWEWIGGTKTNSLLTFTTSASSEIIQGITVPYILWTNNTATIGARKLRFYTT
ncbi:MAG: hypothetical protein HPY57_13935 [Ignavibacteria bacterium]|nr:hypothetical protein [Ignavibacteria bacterium]